jgi:hypothetical protein
MAAELVAKAKVALRLRWASAAVNIVRTAGTPNSRAKERQVHWNPSRHVSIERDADSEQRAGEQHPREDAAARRFLAFDRRH